MANARNRFLVNVFPAAILFFLPAGLHAQVTPALTIYDFQGTPFTAPDNSTVFTASPGAVFSMELTGAPSAPFGLFMSLYTTPFPRDLTPPPLFLMPPLLPVVAGPSFLLGADGSFSFNGIVPTAFSGLGYDLSIYFQAFVQDPVEGFTLSNGIEMVIASSKYKADLAVAYGDDLSTVTLFGRIRDPDAGDNQLPPGGGGGLENGAPLVPDPDIPQGTYAFRDDPPPPEGYPNPSTSIYLNGRFSLVPGDAGFDKRFLLYPMDSSSPYVYARDRICRSGENHHLQHVIVPAFDEQGQKIQDLNVYAFHDTSTGEYGFMALDVLNNDFYELTGTRKKSNNPGLQSVSPWDPHVAVSPDGRYMAAVLKDRTGDYVNQVEELYIVKLRKDDLWSTGLHARKAKINDPMEQSFRETRVFAESMVFGRASSGYPYILFFVTNKYNKLAMDPYKEEPPIENASLLWSLNPNAENGKAVLKKFADLPATGSGYPVTYFGAPAVYLSIYDHPNELQWITSEDRSVLACRAAGRFSELDPQNNQWNLGEWSWDVFVIHDIQGASTYQVANITGFKEPQTHGGFYVAPFGGAWNGWAKAAMNPTGTAVAFVARDSADPKVDAIDDLYFAPTDGSMAGVLYDQPLTHPAVFKGEFLPPSGDQRGRGVYDPFFVDEDDLLFFCGKGPYFTSPYFPPKTDLFLYRDTYGELKNLTNTAGESIPDPPQFTKFGDIRPAGIFASRDGRYVFFFRGKSWDFYAKEMTNLVGIDPLNGFALFDLSGSEFGSGGFVPDLACRKLNYTIRGPSSMNIVLVPTENTDLLLFTAKYNDHKLADSYQVFMLNLDFPIAALPVTSFDPENEPGWIDNLVGDPSGGYIAFSRSDRVEDEATDGAHEKIFIVDLAHGAYTRDLTQSFPAYDRASVDDSFRFLPPVSAETPGSLVFGYGLGGNDDFADNPPNARMWLYPLEGVSDPGLPSVAYPLTERHTILPFNMLPYLE